MKRVLIFSLTQLLIFIAPLGTAFAGEPMTSAEIEAQYERGRQEGFAAADSMGSTARWTSLGLVGTLMLGPIGTLTVANFSQTNVHEVPLEGVLGMANESQQYRDGFRAGYSENKKAEALRHALIGGLIGMGVLGAVARIVSNNQ